MPDEIRVLHLLLQGIFECDFPALPSNIVCHIKLSITQAGYCFANDTPPAGEESSFVFEVCLARIAV